MKSWTVAKRPGIQFQSFSYSVETENPLNQHLDYENDKESSKETVIAWKIYQKVQGQ